VAADLRGDLLGAEADVGRGADALYDGDVRWLSPLALWTGILAGPVAWAFDLTVSYALVKWTCISQREGVLHLMSTAALVVVAGGAIVSFTALRRTRLTATDGGDPLQRARFMAILGLTSCALFALMIVAGAIPRWMLDACQ
jgi:hypothetical protein